MQSFEKKEIEKLIQAGSLRRFVKGTIRINSHMKLKIEETKGEQIGEKIDKKNGLESKEVIEENIEGMTEGKTGGETIERRKTVMKLMVNEELEESLLDTYT